MAHSLKGYARWVQRQATESPPSYQAALRFVEDYLGVARVIAFNDKNKPTIRDVLVRIWDTSVRDRRRAEKALISDDR